MKKRPENMENKSGGGLKRRLASAFIIAAAVLFLVFAPKYFAKGLGGDEYYEWMKLQRESPVEVIKVWHVVGVRPFSGSLGSFLKKSADEYSKNFIGVYFEVKSYSSEAAQEQLERGNIPDIISFSKGAFPASMFLDTGVEVSEPLLAYPYCASKRVIVYAEGANGVPDEKGTPELFKRGKCDCCICDVRAAGDLYRASLIGKCRTFLTSPAEGSPEAQYLGISSDAEEAKKAYAVGFIEYVLSPEKQSELIQLGLIPMDPTIDADYEPEWLNGLYGPFDPSSIPPAFDTLAKPADMC